MRRLGFALLLAASRFLNVAAEPKAAPRHDPPEQLVRRAPVADSARSIIVNLSTNLHYAFDPELARVHTVWLGQSLNLWGPPYSYAKAPFICDFNGKVLFSFPQISPWVAGQESLKTRFRTIDTLSNKVSLSYDILSGAGNIPVVETWKAEGSSAIRTLTFPHGCSHPVSYVAFAESGASFESLPRGINVRSTNGPMAIVADPVSMHAQVEHARYETVRVTEEGTEKGFEKQRFDGPELRARISLPVRKDSFAISISYNFDFPLSSSPLPRGETRIFQGASERRANGGDESYRIEYFPLPPETEMLITGMAWLTERDIVVCTWLGEIFLIKGATGDAARATYHRFARGLNEPLGIAVHQGVIYVVQKGELTKVTDSDGDGVADRFECINNSWGYSGNYHSYSFGPLIDSAENIYVFIAGQRGLYDLPFQGWALKIGPGGDPISPFCSGLRVPHGWGFFGPDHDIFATDNQGNWIGACRLNHLRPGKFYGFPSSIPSTRATSRAGDVEPPVLWFPRSLAPSASGFDTISDERFGPFKGQLLIGDFQNSIIMRAFVEKIEGDWQGVVFPFAKGFLSGVNRLAMGPDGKLYVGGGKRTWSTAAPREFSLDRVSFTGQEPFEVAEVRATPNGFDLAFTRSIDAISGSEAANYLVKQFAYRYHQDYGSPEFDHSGKTGATETPVTSVAVSPDRRLVHLTIPSLRTGYVTSFQLAINGVEDEDLRNDTFYYTLNKRPKAQ